MLNIKAYNSIPSDLSKQLNSLRGFSALIVVIAHASQIFISNITMTYFGITVIIAQAAVMIFFVLSGFLIGKSLTSNYQRNQVINAREFFTSRINRIYPPLLFSLLLTVVLSFLSPFVFASGTYNFIHHNPTLPQEIFTLNIKQLLLAIFFMNGFADNTPNMNLALWSLSLEVWYYIIAFFLMKKEKPFYKVVVIILFITLSFLNRTFFILSFVWFLGFLLCLIDNNKEIKICKTRDMLKYISFSLMLITAIFYLNDIKNYNIYIPFFHIFTGIFIFSYLYSIIKYKSNFPLSFIKLSNFSYILYIIHFPILLFIFGIFENFAIHNLPINIMFAITASIISILVARLSANIEKIQIFKKC